MNIIKINLFGASILAVAASISAHAQDNAPAATPPVKAASTQSVAKDIIVTARRRDESVQDVPSVVNTVTSDQISQLNLRDFKEIQQIVPGLSMSNNTNGVGTTSSVRGVNFDANASGANGTIEYYLNDTPVTAGAIFNAMFDIGQIEVLRGPQGTLRGRASPSGSITVSHRAPDLYEAGGYVEGTLNDISGRNLNAALGIPVIEGKLAIRASGLIAHDQGTRVRSINNGRDPYNSSEAGRIVILAQPTDFLEGQFSYQRLDLSARQFEQAASFSLFSPSAITSPLLITPGQRLGIRSQPLTSHITFDTFTWKLSAAFMGQKLYYAGQNNHQVVSSFESFDEGSFYPTLDLGQFTTTDSKFKNHEVRLQNEEKVFGMFDYVVGYFQSDLNSPTYIITERLAGSVASPTLIASGTLRETKTSEKSIFGNLSIHIGPNTEISGGARHIKVDQQSSLGVVTIAGGVAIPPPIVTDISEQILSGTVTNLAAGNVDRQFRKTIFAASAKHNFSRDLLVYANFGTSFRPGNNVVRATINQRESALETGFLVLPSETSKSYEIGVKSEFFDRTLTLNVAAFQQDFKNYAFRSPSGVPYLQYDTPASPTPGRVALFNFVSPVPVRVRGFELESNWRPSRQFNMGINVAYALGKIRNGQVACLDLNGDGVPDAGTPQASALFAAVGADNLSTCAVNFRSSTASPWSGTAQAEYSHPVSNNIEGFVRGLVTYSSSSLTDPANIYDDYGSYARLSLYLGIRDADHAWNISFYGKNILNDKTVLSTSNGAVFTTVGATVVSSPYINIGTRNASGLGTPREFGLTARFAFGSR